MSPPLVAFAQDGTTNQGGGPDVLFLALITAAAFAGATALSLLFYLIRLRIGFWLHRPPPRREGEATGHH